MRGLTLSRARNKLDILLISISRRHCQTSISEKNMNLNNIVKFLAGNKGKKNEIPYLSAKVLIIKIALLNHMLCLCGYLAF